MRTKERETTAKIHKTNIHDVESITSEYNEKKKLPKPTKILKLIKARSQLCKFTAKGIFERET